MGMKKSISSLRASFRGDFGFNKRKQSASTDSADSSSETEESSSEYEAQRPRSPESEEDYENEEEIEAHRRAALAAANSDSDSDASSDEELDQSKFPGANTASYGGLSSELLLKRRYNSTMSSSTRSLMMGSRSFGNEDFDDAPKKGMMRSFGGSTRALT